jgi:hypothetical protein
MIAHVFVCTVGALAAYGALLLVDAIADSFRPSFDLTIEEGGKRRTAELRGRNAEIVKAAVLQLTGTISHLHAELEIERGLDHHARQERVQ